ncbi:MAG TPA: FxLYD domain-containing protein [Candidatus Kryptonia bacterium]|nr:FxLYD domain-containing protein [Candidatus Kryptonia bacterium]
MEAPTPALREEKVEPLEQPQLEIVDLQETPSADKKLVTLTGILRNHGTGPTHHLLVRVEARDENDAVLLSADAAPTTEVVPPGATATFTVTVENRREVARYHVEALAR